MREYEINEIVRSARERGYNIDIGTNNLFIWAASGSLIFSAENVCGGEWQCTWVSATAESQFL